MSVESFDPSAVSQLDQGRVSALCQLCKELDPQLAAGSIVLDAVQIAEFSNTAKQDWRPFLEALDSDVLLSLIRFFTLAEAQYSGFAAGDKSPVIAMVRVLKGRGDYSSDVTGWIKQHSDNKFLPHGSLMDRLG